jgi:DNA-binding transcriptional MerR regulator
MLRSLASFIGRNWSFLLTFLYFGYLIGLIKNNSQSLLELDLNELGDFLAGAVGPVAFFWLVHGYFQQNAAIKIQSDELRAAVDQHKAQVIATNTLAEHDLRLARIDYYRLLAETGGTIRECKRLLIEPKNSRTPFGFYSSSAVAAAIYGEQQNGKELSKKLATFLQRQKEFEHDVVHLNSLSFGELETSFLRIMKHAAEARSLLQEIETYISKSGRVRVR